MAIASDEAFTRRVVERVKRLPKHLLRPSINAMDVRSVAWKLIAINVMSKHAHSRSDESEDLEYGLLRTSKIYGVSSIILSEHVPKWQSFQFCL